MSDMTKELLSRADVIFGKVAEAASQAGSFAMEQLPDIATQFILYSRVYHTTMLLFVIIGLVLVIWLTFKYLKSSVRAVLLAAIPCGIGLMSLFAVYFQTSMMVWFALGFIITREIVKLAK